MGYVSYSACGVPYFIDEKVKSAERQVVYDTGFFEKDRDIDVLLRHEVKHILSARVQCDKVK